MQGQSGKNALPAIYTMTRTPTHARIIPRGVPRQISSTGLFLSASLFGMVRNDAYNGNFARNPFNFQLFDVNAVRLMVNGEEIPYSVIDLTGGKRIDGFNTLFSGSGDMNCGHGIDMTEKIGEVDTVYSAWIPHVAKGRCMQKICFRTSSLDFLNILAFFGSVDGV